MSHNLKGSVAGVSKDSPDSPSHSARRILFSVRYLWGNEGITTQLTALVKELKARGWDVGLMAGFDPDKLDEQPNLEWLVRNTSYFFIPAPKHLGFSEIFKFPFITHKVISSVLSYKPSLIHIFSLSLTPYFFLARILTGVRYLSRVAIEPDPDKMVVKLGSTVSSAISNYFGDFVIAISSGMVAPLRDMLNIGEDRIHVILNGIDTTHFRPPSEKEETRARDSFNIDQDSYVVSIVGRLHWIKGHDILFRAIKILQNEGINIIVLCAGSGDHEQEIENLASELCIRSQVRFLGYTDSRDVYWSSDLLVLPSKREGFANVIAEGMLCGTIPIRTPGAGANDQIEEARNGFTIPYDDPQALADTIRYVVNHPKEQKNIEIRAARTALERFSLERMVDETEKLYLSLM
jgi:glycosyltransferase involved in cell wall biosynthesis